MLASAFSLRNSRKSIGGGVAIGATLSKDSEELELRAKKNCERRIFFIYFFGEPAILFVNEVMILLAKARREARGLI